MQKLVFLMILIASHAVVLAQGNPSKSASAQSDAKKAFAKLKTLEGSWQGTVMGTSVNVTIRLASSGTAILHEATGDGTLVQTLHTLNELATKQIAPPEPIKGLEAKPTDVFLWIREVNPINEAWGFHDDFSL